VNDLAENRMTVGDLRAALSALPDDDWIVLYDPRLDRRLWLDHVDPSGHAVLVAVKR
jgi:hypothetical protein